MISHTVTDELESIADLLCTKYPDHGGDEIAAVVHDVYDRLSAEATVTAHLIPLTLNRCHKLLSCQVVRPTKILSTKY